MTTDTQRLDWLQANPQIEIRGDGYYCEDPAWTAFRCSGGINDREWDKIAEGDTLREVIDAAMKAKPNRPPWRGRAEKARAAYLENVGSTLPPPLTAIYDL